MEYYPNHGLLINHRFLNQEFLGVFNKTPLVKEVGKWEIPTDYYSVRITE